MDSTIPKVPDGEVIDLILEQFPQVTTHGKKGAQELDYVKLPLSNLPKDVAAAFCNELYSEPERFFQGFHRYYTEIMNLPPEQALESAREERQTSISALLSSLDDPYYSTIGFYDQSGTYIPTALYGLRPVESHLIGQKLLDQLESTGHMKNYPGKIGFAHNFSALTHFRNIALMRFVFACIAVDAVIQGYDHLFFFMSDHRLGRIYKHFGLDFPDFLKLPDAQYLVGSYTISSQYLAIYQEVVDLNLAAPEASPTNIVLNERAKKIMYLDKVQA